MKKLLFIPLLFICSVVYASPSINSISEGTINGSSFGTKSSASPHYWDTFENGVDTSADIGTWSSITSLTESGSSNRYSGSSKNATYNFRFDSADDEAAYVRCDSTLSTNWYVSFWFMIENDFDWGNSLSYHLGNVKFFRLWNPGSVNENFVQAFHPTPRVYSSFEYITDSGITATSFETYRTDITKGVWHHLEFEYSESDTIISENGTFKYWFDGDLKLSNIGLKTREDYDVNKRPYAIGFYNSNSDGVGDNANGYHFDDVYVDTTWARVMVGNSSTLSTSTHREIQIPTEWSDTSATVMWNQGTFLNGETAYLFVVDSDGNVSDGYEGYFIDGTFYTGCSTCSLEITGSLQISGSLNIS